MRNATLIALAIVSAARALVGDWTSYTPLYDVRAFASAKGFLFAGSSGGIRKINAATRAETAYRNREGLIDVGINALAASPEGDVFATSELGYLYQYDWAADDWLVLDAGYKGAGWHPSKRALVYHAGYLVLGADKGLSFFNVKRRVAEANVAKLETASGLSVNSLLFVGDTLFAGTSQGIFRAFLHFDRLLTDPQINIFNPAIWTNVVKGGFYYDPTLPSADSTGANPDTGLHLPAAPDPNLSHGVLYYGPKGIASDYDGVVLTDPPARVSTYRSTFTVDGKEYPNSYGFRIVGWAAGHWFLGLGFELNEFLPRDSGEYIGFRNPTSLPYNRINTVRANRYGVYALGNPNVYQLHGKVWDSVAVFGGIEDRQEWSRRGLHSFDVPGPREFIAGLWGGGIQDIRGGERTIIDATNSCLASSAFNDTNYVAVSAMAPYRDKGYFISALADKASYQLAYFNRASVKLECIHLGNHGDLAHNLEIVGDTMLVVVNESGLEAYRIRDEGGHVSVNPENLLSRLRKPNDPTLAGRADAFGNYWVTTEGATLLYVPNLTRRPDSAISFQSLEGFTGIYCANLERDPRGHLWTGCNEGGVFEVVPGKDSTLHTFGKYGLNDGLLTETIYNLSVNPDNGDVWVTTEKGVSRYESPSRPPPPDLSGVKAYPNPFLPKHQAVVFDNLAAGSEVEVLTQSGEVVFRRTLSKGGAGDQIRWDGRNPAGKRVTEGVYFYVVKSPKETKHGKLIVAR